MKRSILSLSVVAACATLSAPAFALPASSYTNTGEFVGSTQNIRISGATAQDPGLLAAALSRFCAAGTMHRYSISNTFVYFCSPNAALTLRGGATQLAIHKFSVGGSGAGVGFVNNATSIAFLDLTRVAATCTGANATVVTNADVDTAGPLPSFVDVTCIGATSNYTTNTPSYIGISDVEPSFFGPAAGVYDRLASSSLATVIFGVPVTRNIFEAMQRQQGLATQEDQDNASATPPVAITAACGATNMAGLLSEACMPSLSQAQLTSAFTQEGQTWAGIGVESGLDDDTIYVTRRVDSSGTQKSFEAVVAKTPNGTLGGKSCFNNVDGFLSGVIVNNNTEADSICNAAVATATTFNTNGSGQAIRCLENHNRQARGSIGVLSTEFRQSAAGLLRFIKANGVAPTHAGVASGRYQYYADAALNTRTGANLPTAAALGYPAFLTLMRSSFASPTIIATINGLPQTFGATGLMALDALATPVPAPDFTGAASRNPWNRLVGSAVLDNCQSGKVNF